MTKSAVYVLWALADKIIPHEAQVNNSRSTIYVCGIEQIIKWVAHGMANSSLFQRKAIDKKGGRLEHVMVMELKPYV